jgi:hypothetical protein
LLLEISIWRIYGKAYAKDIPDGIKDIGDSLNNS